MGNYWGKGFIRLLFMEYILLYTNYSGKIIRGWGETKICEMPENMYRIIFYINYYPGGNYGGWALLECT